MDKFTSNREFEAKIEYDILQGYISMYRLIPNLEPIQEHRIKLIKILQSRFDEKINLQFEQNCIKLLNNAGKFIRGHSPCVRTRIY